MTRAPLVVLLLLLPAYAGCLAEDPPSGEPVANAAASAEAAGARSGEAPVAPKEAYAIAGEDATAYPVPIATNPAKAPVTVDLSGAFSPADCRPLNFGPLEEAALSSASTPRRWSPLDDVLAVGDVYEYNITLTYANAADNWGEIHVAYGLGSTIREDDVPAREMTDVVVSFSGQGMRASEDDMAWVFVGCFLGAMSRPIPYTLTASFRFAEGAVPAEAPILVSVPEGATRMFVRGVAVDAEEGVLSHFRIFKPDDTLLCECALSSADEVATVELPGPGDYVLLVDHTSNGFVGVALDAETDVAMRPLGAEWIETTIYANDGGAVDDTTEFDLPRVPLVMFAHVMEKDAAGAGKHTTLSVTNTRGEPLRASWGGHVAWNDPVGGSAWLGFWPADWEFTNDHHAFAQGHHSAAISAEALRGEIVLVTRQYVR